MEGTSSMVVNEEDDVILDLPPGFRFHPTDEEIITHYLTHKAIDDRFTSIAISQVDMNKCEPWDLPKKSKMKEKEWFFFCQRDRKYPTGMRTNRATGRGYWKATGKDREIYNKNKRCLIGMKKTLVFYKGRAPKGEKTNWVMHEYRLEGRLPYYRAAKDEWVVSKIFQKSNGIIIKRNSFGHEHNNSSINDCFIDEIVGSPSSSSLPPSMEDIPTTSPQSKTPPWYAPTTTTTTTLDEEHDFKDLFNSSMNAGIRAIPPQIQEFDQKGFLNSIPYPITNAFKSSYLNTPIQENPYFYHHHNNQECRNPTVSAPNRNGMISPSQDTEISSSVDINASNTMAFEDLEGISVNHNMTDLDSLWDY